MATPSSGAISASDIRNEFLGPTSTSSIPLGGLKRDDDSGTPVTDLQPPNIRVNSGIPKEDTSDSISYSDMRGRSDFTQNTTPVTFSFPNSSIPSHGDTPSPHAHIQTIGITPSVNRQPGPHGISNITDDKNFEGTKEVIDVTLDAGPLGSYNYTFNTPSDGGDLTAAVDANTELGTISTTGNYYIQKTADEDTYNVRGKAEIPHGYHGYYQHPHHHASQARYYNYSCYNSNVSQHMHWHGYGHGAHFNYGSLANSWIAHFPNIIQSSHHQKAAGVQHQWHYDPRLIHSTSGSTHLPHHTVQGPTAHGYYDKRKADSLSDVPAHITWNREK